MRRGRRERTIVVLPFFRTLYRPLYRVGRLLLSNPSHGGKLGAEFFLEQRDAESAVRG
jgi:hypothetical protein